MKTCYSCQQIKPLSEFRLRTDTEKYRGACLVCEKEYKRLWRLRPQHIQKDRERRRGNNDPEHKIRMAKYSKEHRKQINEWIRKFRANRPKSELVRRKFRNALCRGEVKKEAKCQECGSEIRVASHHPDYNKPLAVEWLCSSCHGKRHRKKDIVIPEPTEAK